MHHINQLIDMLPVSQYRLIQYMLLLFLLVTLGTCYYPSCMSSIDVSGPKGVKLDDVFGSYFTISLENNFYSNATVEFKFRTVARNGLLFYMSRKYNNSEIVGMQILDNHLVYTIRCRHGHATIVLDGVKINGNRWHTIAFHRNGHQGKIKLDGREYFGTYPVGCGEFNRITFGGVKTSHWQYDVIKKLQVINEQKGKFRGCISNVTISNEQFLYPIYSRVTTCYKNIR